ncbi:hypothetical protein SFOMI_0813 [Sphingobium fuliginis]|uniref:Uncharacterized protein n=1 Tax=Sphingobium fuliginis (strain ATCC 27551) TaxID=336203 RepID=A0A292ZBP4_SPHSA|nr:hypothetical protein SFOMI_0813 [Sphingobium fuliginis]
MGGGAGESRHGGIGWAWRPLRANALRGRASGDSSQPALSEFAGGSAL